MLLSVHKHFPCLCGFGRTGWGAVPPVKWDPFSAGDCILPCLKKQAAAPLLPVKPDQAAAPLLPVKPDQPAAAR